VSALGPAPVLDAARAQPEVEALALDERLARAAASARALRAAAEEVVDLAVREVGQARRFARRELASALGLLAALPELAEAIRSRAVPAVAGETRLEWRPYGVVLGWHSANSPAWVPTVVVASALVGGNAIVSRPSRRAAKTTGRVLQALAGPWPEGAVARLDLPPDEAESLIAHPGVHAVVAHASTATVRRHLARLGAAYAQGAPLRPYIPEASGNDALVVLAGGDLARAAEAAALGGFANAGQLCLAAKRIVVEARAWPAFRSRLEIAVGALRLGDPEDERTDVAPLPEGPARARARAALAEALALGGEVVAGEGERDGRFTPHGGPPAPARPSRRAVARGELRAASRRDPGRRPGRGAGARQRHPLRPRRGGVRTARRANRRGRGRASRGAGPGRGEPPLPGPAPGGGRRGGLGPGGSAPEARAAGLGAADPPRRRLGQRGAPP